MPPNVTDETEIETTDTSLTVRRTFDAPRERVFEACTHPRQVDRWWGPEGFTTTTDEMDVQAGGVWRFVMHGPDGVDHHNTFPSDEVVEPERLVYTHAGEGGRPGFQVTVTFDEGADDGTNLTFRMDFDSASDRETLEEFGGVEAANQTLDRLEGFLANDGVGGAK